MSLGQIAFPDVSGNSTKLDFSKISPADLEKWNRIVFEISNPFSKIFFTKSPKIALQQPKFSQKHQKFFQPMIPFVFLGMLGGVGFWKFLD